MKNIQISDEIHKKLKTQCAENGQMIKFVIEQLILSHFETVESIGWTKEEKAERIKLLLEKRKSAGNKPYTSK